MVTNDEARRFTLFAVVLGVAQGPEIQVLLAARPMLVTHVDLWLQTVFDRSRLKDPYHGR